jgi:predicted deacylase
MKKQTVSIRVILVVALPCILLFSLAAPEGNTIVIGQTVDGKSLELTRVGDGTRIACVMVGAIHGDEGNTAAVVEALMRKYVDQPELVPASHTLFFLPAFNADGIERRTHGNARQVDLNHNFPTMDWISNAYDFKKTVPGLGGTAPASEPEVRAMVSFLTETVKPAFGEVRVLIFHSASPPVGYCQPGYLKNGVPELKSARLAEAAAKAGGYNFLRGWVDKKPITGEFIRFCAEHGLLSMDIELPTYDMPDSVPKGKKESTFASCAKLVEALLAF